MNGLSARRNWSPPAVGLGAVLLAALLAGCVTHGPWEERYQALAMPWCAPDVHAVEKLRRIDSLAGTLAGSEFRYESRWIGAKGARRDPHKIARQVEDAVRQTAIFRQLPQQKLMGLDMPREMPNIVALVSIDPVVVLLIPWTYQDGRHARSPESPHSSTLGTELWTGDIDCGTSFAYRPGVLWLSPGVQDEPAPLEPTGPDRFRILTPTVHLEFEVKDGWLRSTRLK